MLSRWIGDKQIGGRLCDGRVSHDGLVEGDRADSSAQKSQRFLILPSAHSLFLKTQFSKSYLIFIPGFCTVV
jgi:hypothetical protein